MLTFTPVTQRDIARLRRYYKSCEYQLCEYSALVKLMWRSHLHPSWAEGAGCLIVRNFIDGQYCFDYPVPGPDGRRGRGAHAHRGRLPRAGYSPRPLRRPAGQGGAPCRALPLLPLFLPARLARLYLRRRGSARLCRTPLLRSAQPHQQVPQALSRRRLPPAREERPAAHHAVLPRLRGRLHQGVRLGEKRAALRRENAPHDRQPALPRRRHGAGRQAPLRRHGGALRRHAANSYRKSPLRL